MQTASANASITRLLRAATLEVYSKNAPAQLDTGLAPGSDVYVSYLPGDDAAKRVEIATALRKGGYNPVPHVPARQMLNHEMLDEYIARATGEAGVTRVFLIAGDSSRPRGPYANSLDVIRSGVLEKRGIAHVDLAGHPEGNAGFDARELTDILIAKRDAVLAVGLSAGVVTQFCFDPHPIADWLHAVDTAGLDCPIRIGLAGPANPATLMKFAMRCGVGNSIMALQKHVGTVGRLLRDTGPDGVVRGLADTLGGNAGKNVENFHFFPFGGLEKTLGWIASAIAEAEG